MKPLLTLNGIPPQIVGAFDVAHQRDAFNNSNWKHGLLPANGVALPATPFVATVTRLAGLYVEWGAKLAGLNYIESIGRDLDMGQTTFNNPQLHSDASNGLANLLNKNKLILRVLCVSSLSPFFIDLTTESDMAAILNRYRVDQKHYSPALLEDAKKNTVETNTWDITAFDTISPHCPIKAVEPHFRVLQHAWVGLKLPTSWRERVAVGDTPHL